MRNLSFIHIGLFILVITIAGCGGGGSSSGPSTPTGLSYTGLSTPATVTPSNADTLAGTGLYGTTAGDTMALSLSSGSGAEEKIKHNLIGLGQTLTTVAKTVDPDSAATPAASKAMSSVSESRDGTCGGSSSYSITYDDTNGAFSGDMTFTSYDDCNGGTISGSVNFSGTLDPQSQEPGTFTFSFDNLSSTVGQNTQRLSGTMSVRTISTYSYTVTCNMFYEINSATVCKLENFVMTYDELVNPPSVSISGRAYHPDHGYVIFSTPTALRIYSTSEYPHAGSVLLTGKNGSSGGATGARVTFTGVNDYGIEVDSTGDGTYDSNLSCTWTPDSCTSL